MKKLIITCLLLIAAIMTLTITNVSYTQKAYAKSKITESDLKNLANDALTRVQSGSAQTMEMINKNKVFFSEIYDAVGGFFSGLSKKKDVKSAYNDMLNASDYKEVKKKAAKVSNTLDIAKKDIKSYSKNETESIKESVEILTQSGINDVKETFENPDMKKNVNKIKENIFSFIFKK